MSVAAVVDTDVVGPAGVRLQIKSLAGLLAQAPALAVQNVELAFTWTVQERFAITLSEIGVKVATPVAWFMSVVAAVYVEEVGEMESCSSAGFTIVAGWSSVTVGEHFPDCPETLQLSTVCAATAGVASASAAQIASDAMAKRANPDARPPALTVRLARCRAFPSAALS